MTTKCMEISFGNVTFSEGQRGLDISVFYVDMNGSLRCVSAAVSEKYGIDFYTGYLDENGLKALNRLVAITTALFEGGKNE